ncbi:MAG TPA: choice-of-anchor J domain-containing protein [Aquaticitalea sp.]|nr:choice-of-anchor J domain-containing protein [Aquaticitalea sp.]
MKKITFLFLSILFSYSGFSQISEDFEGATFPPAGWTVFVGENGLGTVENWKQQLFDTNTAVCVWELLPGGQRSEDWLVTPQVTVTAENPSLTFDSVDSGTTDYGSIYTVRVSTASQNVHSDFTIVDTQTELEIAHSQTTMVGSNRSIDLSAYIGQSIYIAFVLEQNDGDLWRIDNVMIDSDLSVEDFNTSSYTYNYNKDSDMLTLESSTIAFNNLQMFNILGQEVMNKPLSQTSETISLANLQDGVYIAKIQIGGQIETVKLLKQ